MAKFTATLVEPIEYDFKGIPSRSGKGMCSGKGVIPEPTEEAIDQVQKAAEEFAKDNAEASFTDVRAKMTELLVTLQIPKAHLEELPYRHFNEFRDFVLGELLPNAG